jgi:hypothetical protein
MGVRPLAGGVFGGEGAVAWVYEIAEVHAHCCTAAGTAVLRAGGTAGVLSLVMKMHRT